MVSNFCAGPEFSGTNKQKVFKFHLESRSIPLFGRLHQGGGMQIWQVLGIGFSVFGVGMAAGGEICKVTESRRRIAEFECDFLSRFRNILQIKTPRAYKGRFFVFFGFS